MSHIPSLITVITYIIYRDDGGPHHMNSESMAALCREFGKLTLTIWIVSPLTGPTGPQFRNLNWVPTGPPGLSLWSSPLPGPILTRYLTLPGAWWRPVVESSAGSPSPLWSSDYVPRVAGWKLEIPTMKKRTMQKLVKLYVDEKHLMTMKRSIKDEHLEQECKQAIPKFSKLP